MTLIFWVLLTSLVGAMIVAPQAVAAWEMPSLVLERASVREALDEDEERASKLQESPEIDDLQRLFLEHGEREADSSDTRQEYDRRQALISHKIETLEGSGGPELVAALRADATERFIEVFSRRGASAQTSEAKGRWGAFGQMLHKYGLIYEGVVIAPEMTVRAVYKARWNAIHRRPLVDGLSPIELQAYWGWLALHAAMFPLERRVEALQGYAAAGGRSSTEAAAMFALIAQEPERAVEPLEQLYEDSGRIRFRNLALGAKAVTQLR
jgi:hypothetical protein